jgi:hypothetical protein
MAENEYNKIVPQGSLPEANKKPRPISLQDFDVKELETLSDKERQELLDGIDQLNRPQERQAKETDSEFTTRTAKRNWHTSNYGASPKVVRLLSAIQAKQPRVEGAPTTRDLGHDIAYQTSLANQTLDESRTTALDKALKRYGSFPDDAE